MDRYVLNYEGIVDDAAALGLLVYKDPDCRDRFIIVDAKRWTLDALISEVARDGGMREGPLFIGTQQGAWGFLQGYQEARPLCSPRQ